MNSKYSKEEIPNEDIVYCRVRGDHVDPNGVLLAAALREHGDPPHNGKSCDWSRYSTPDSCMSVATEEQIYLMSFIVGDIRAIPLQDVIHDPLDDNQAHSNITGLDQKAKQERAKIRHRYYIIYKWVEKYSPRKESNSSDA